MPQTLLTWVKRVEIDTGVREGVTTSDVQRMKELERENKELRRATAGQGHRQFKADLPNQLWVSDFTYVSSWQGWQ